MKSRLEWLRSGFKLAVIPALFLLIFAAISFFTLTSLQRTRENALVTDLSGRQRTLNQRYMKEILLAGRGIPVDYLYTRAVFDETLEALLHGGPAVLKIGEEKRVQLLPAPTEPIREKLEEQKKLWKGSTAAADGLLKIPMTDPSYASELRIFLENGELLHSVISDQVKLFEQHSWSKADGSSTSSTPRSTARTRTRPPRSAPPSRSRGSTTPPSSRTTAPPTVRSGWC
jgi:hypothetical protein